MTLQLLHSEFLYILGYCNMIFVFISAHYVLNACCPNQLHCANMSGRAQETAINACMKILEDLRQSHLNKGSISFLHMQA
jgi:hypothetical protein